MELGFTQLPKPYESRNVYIQYIFYFTPRSLYIILGLRERAIVNNNKGNRLPFKIVFIIHQSIGGPQLFVSHLE